MSTKRSRLWRQSGGRPGSAVALVVLPLLAIGCTTPTPQALLDARASVAAAEADPEVSQLASVELYEAEKALQRADSEWTRQGDVQETEHLAYLVQRRVEAAKLNAAGAKSMKEAEELSRQLERVLLEARTGEAERALTAAEMRAREAERERLLAEQARQEAEVARREAEESAERERKLREELAELQARQTERGLVLTLGDVLFDVDQATLKPGAMQNLYRLATFLTEYPERQVVVEGHTDSTGSEAYNLDLSQRRAESVTRFLQENGIEAARMVARGYGKAYPVATNDTAAGRQRNRRVEIVILEAGEAAAEQARPLPSP